MKSEDIKNYFKKIFYLICITSLVNAAKEQGLNKLIIKLRKIVPNIENQYSRIKLNSGYLKTKVRNMHAFQISLVNRVIEEFQNPTIVDIGDSAGTHLEYIAGLYSRNKDMKTMSVNLDPEAVRRIKTKGLNAVKARAENLEDYDINTDFFLCFEMLEHLTDPCRFLHKLSSETNAKYLIITVPYLKHSRVGLHHLRGAKRRDVVNAEDAHIFELNPGDWKLIMKHSGWAVVDEQIYFQYPKKSFLRITKPVWKKFDFEGFYGMILKKDNTWSSRYSDW